MFMPSPRSEPLHIAEGSHAYRGRIVSAPSRSQKQKELQQRQRAWLSEVVTATRLKPSQIAAGAGVSDTTLTRLMNNPDYSGTLSQVTIDRIKETYKVPGPEEFASARRPSLIGFAEAERFDIKRAQREIARIVEAIVEGRPHVDPWRLRTGALEGAGYLSGDIVFVDQDAVPHPQDAVCAQVTDFQRGSAETVWRVYDPPFLVAAAHDRTAYKPLLVDQERVMIRGVIVDSFRAHRLSATR